MIHSHSQHTLSDRLRFVSDDISTSNHRERKYSEDSRPEWNDNSFRQTNGSFDQMIELNKPETSVYAWVPTIDDNGISMKNLQMHEAAGWTVVPASRHAQNNSVADSYQSQIMSSYLNPHLLEKRRMIDDFEQRAVLKDGQILMEKDKYDQEEYDRNVNSMFYRQYDRYGPGGSSNVNSERPFGMTYTREELPMI